MKVKTVDGIEIDVTDWVDQMRKNIRLKRDIREGTPFGQTLKKKYFWWDEEKNPTLDARSVNKLFRAIRNQ